MSAEWDRQRGEPPRAHVLFESYLALGPGRSLRGLARSGVASHSYLKKLSSRWQWAARAASWQAELRQAVPVNPQEMATEARARQLKDALALQQLARAQLSRWIAKDAAGTVRLLRRLSPHQVARLWQTGYRVESLLLPPPSPPEPPPDVAKRAREARVEQEAPTEDLDLVEEMAKLFALVRKADFSRARIAQHHAQLLRWLWLPGETSLSLPALTKANRTRSLRRHDHTRTN